MSEVKYKTERYIDENGDEGWRVHLPTYNVKHYYRRGPFRLSDFWSTVWDISIFIACILFIGLLGYYFLF